MKEAVTAETNLNGKKARKSPVPSNVERIFEGALKLPLEVRISLRDGLTDSINTEVNEMELDLHERSEKWIQAKKLIGG